MMNKDERMLKPVNIAILTVSDSRTLDEDKSGQILSDRITQAGHQVVDRMLVMDDIYKIRAIVSAWIADDSVEVVITTGGTGLTGRDSTPEAMKVLYDKEIEGFGEVFRWVSYNKIGTSTIQSRAVAGLANGTVLFSLPGSTGACKDAWDDIISHQLNNQYRPCNLVDIMPRFLEQ